MTLPNEGPDPSIDPDDGFSDPSPRVSKRSLYGWGSLLASFVILLALALAPAPYVVQTPGPVFNVLGTTGKGDEKKPVISISGTETHDVGDTLDMLTVSVVGNPESSPSWLQVVQGWFDPREAVLPMAAVFPEGTTTEERDEESQVMMVNSQQDAVAAALTEMDVDFDTSLMVGKVVSDSPSDGEFDVGDELVSASGKPIEDITQLHEAVDRNGDDSAMSVTVRRDGAQKELSVTPEKAAGQGNGPRYVLGIQVSQTYEFPFDVAIRLNDVGGPSAGMMFALGIIDKLTPGPLAGDAKVAGTGTIDAEGEVGPIGGIRQKLYGARDGGADYFLAPAANCDEVVGHVPDGLQVFKVDTLEDSLAVMEALADGDDGLDDLPTCTSS